MQFTRRRSIMTCNSIIVSEGIAMEIATRQDCMGTSSKIPTPPPPLHPIAHHRGDPPQLNFFGRIRPRLDTRQEQNRFLDFRGQVHQKHDLRHACGGDLSFKFRHPPVARIEFDFRDHWPMLLRLYGTVRPIALVHLDHLFSACFRPDGESVLIFIPMVLPANKMAPASVSA